MRTDIFGLAPRQQDMFGEPQETFDTMMSEDEIRAELRQVLELLESSDTIPWDTRLELKIRNMFPDIAARLPDSEQFVTDFNAQMRRLRKEAA